MGYLKSIMREEYGRLQALSEKYINKIELLPKGSVSIKKRNNNEYLYLACRRDGKVRFEYVGSLASEKAREVMEQVKSRKEYGQKLKQVKSDLREIEKVIHGRKI